MKKLSVYILFLVGLNAFSQVAPQMNVYFESAKFNITEVQKKEVLNLFKAGSVYVVTLVGYTDSKGSKVYNDKLSLKRAQAIYEMLIKANVKLDKIEYIGKGEFNPAEGDQEKEAKEDRKVEIYIGNQALVTQKFEDDTKVDLAKLNAAKIEQEKAMAQAQADKITQEKKAEEEKKAMKAQVDKIAEDEKKAAAQSEEAIKLAQEKATQDRLKFMQDSIATASGTKSTAQELSDKVVSSGKNMESSEIKNFDDIKKGDEIVFRNILFVDNQPRFVSSSKEDLQQLLGIMNMYPTLKIEIQGHVCCVKAKNTSDSEYINLLSESRARAVFDYLVQNKIDPNRMTYKGFAFEKPLINPEKTDEDQAKNRRVQIMVLEK